MERRDDAFLEDTARIPTMACVHDRAADIVFGRFDHFFAFSRQSLPFVHHVSLCQFLLAPAQSYR